MTDYKLECRDAVAFLKSQEDDSIDLLFTSPPYENARTYGLKDRLPSGQAWVDWMVEIVTASSPKVKGLIAINCEGQTHDYRYSCVPFLLMADLHRAGFNLRKPCVYHRSSIPGSGGPDWMRNDWEPIVCITRPGRLAWSDTTACGRDPKYGPGGKMSHRTKSGGRVMAGIAHDKNGKIVGRPGSFSVPATANPGNVIKCKVGGGGMGHPLAHENEAPMSLRLAEFFVKSFCPPGGVVCDPFLGSGTTLEAAFANGRRFVGCDIRESQIEISKRRIKTVTKNMFSQVEDN